MHLEILSLSRHRSNICTVEMPTVLWSSTFYEHSKYRPLVRELLVSEMLCGLNDYALEMLF